MVLDYYKYYRNITLTTCNLPPANRAPNRLPRRRTETTTPWVMEQFTCKVNCTVA